MNCDPALYRLLTMNLLPDEQRVTAQDATIAQSIIDNLSAQPRPNVTAGVDGEVVLEWRMADRRLSLFIQNGVVEYLRAWNQWEMDDGVVNPDDVARLVEWALS